MSSPLVKWGLRFSAAYLLGWLFLVPQFDAWMDARERQAHITEELPALRLLANGTATSGIKVKARGKASASDVEMALRASGLSFDRIDPHLKDLERGRALYTVAFVGELEQLVQFMEQSQRTSPRLLMTRLNVHTREPGIAGDFQVAALLPSQVKSAAWVSAHGRDPFHPPVLKPAVQRMAPVVNVPPPPPPEPMVMLKLMGVNEVRDLKQPNAPTRLEALVLNQMTNTLDRITTSTYADAGFLLEFDVAKGLIRIMKNGALSKEWKTGQTLNQKMFKRAAPTPEVEESVPTSDQGELPPPPPPPLP